MTSSRCGPKTGGPLRLLNVVDEYTRKGVGFDIARSIGARRVQDHLERLFDRHGRPALIRSDNGKEFTVGRADDLAH